MINVETPGLHLNAFGEDYANQLGENPNAYDVAFGNLNTANIMAANEYGNVTPQIGYNPVTIDQLRPFAITPETVTAGQIDPNVYGVGTPTIGEMQGYETATMAGVSPVVARQLADTDLSKYLNPYIDNVVDTTLSDIGRQNTQAMNQLDAQASAAGAFGGSRHGVAMGETNRGYGDIAARTTADLRDRGFQTAQGAAFQDIANQMRADEVTAGHQLAVNEANARFENAQRAFKAGAINQATMRQAELEHQSAMQEANNRLQADQFNVSSDLGAQTYNADKSFLAQDRHLGLVDQLLRHNADQKFNADKINTDIAQSDAQRRLNIANQLANFGSLSFEGAQRLEDDLIQQGNAQQNMEQALINSVIQQYGSWANTPTEVINMITGAITGAPSSTTSTQTTSQPFDVGAAIGGGLQLGSMFLDPSGTTAAALEAAKNFDFGFTPDYGF